MKEQAHSPRRWRRAQCFSLSELGTGAEAAYRATIIAARTTQGRASFDAARAQWAQSFRVEPDDGLYLAELHQSPTTLERMVDALETCGKTRKDALVALERLFDAGLILAPPVPDSP
jgi:hypothetical protein